MKNQCTVGMLAVLAFFSGFLEGNAYAQVPVTISGFVTDLTGIPHDRPNITIRVRSVRANREIASATSNANGFFSIAIDPKLVPVPDVTLSITADGTAFINGVQTRVRTAGTLFGLGGVIDSKFATRIPNSTERVTQFIMLVVPKEDDCIVCTTQSCYCRHGCFRFRR